VPHGPNAPRHGLRKMLHGFLHPPQLRTSPHLQMHLKRYRFCRPPPRATSAAGSLLPEHSRSPAKACASMQRNVMLKLSFLRREKSALQQRAVAASAEALRHPLPPEPARCGEEGHTCHRLPRPTALQPSTFGFTLPPFRSFTCTNLLATGSKILPRKSPFYHPPVA